MVNRAIGVGFPRAGTTYLSTVLSNHPQVCFASRKETHFFERSDDLAEYDAAYFSHFDAARHTLKAEWTVSYIRDLQALQRIAASFGADVPLLLSFRDPAEAVVSTYYYRRMINPNHPERRMSLEQAIERFPDRYISPYRYDEWLDALLSVFEKPRLLAIDQAAISTSREAVAAEMFDFLGLDQIPVDDRWSVSVNMGLSPRSLLVDRGVRRALRLVYGEEEATRRYRASRKLWPIQLVQRLNTETQEVRQETRRRIEALFAPSTRRFLELLERSGARLCRPAPEPSGGR